MMLIIVFILLFLSVGANVLLLWYIRQMLKEMSFVTNSMGDVTKIIENYSDHIGSIHEMETFYGDPTLQNLMEHSKEVVEEMNRYKEFYLLAEEEELEEMEGYAEEN